MSLPSTPACPSTGRIRLGVDLGGTKIEIIALDDKGESLLRRRASTPQGDYKATMITIGELVRAAESELAGRGGETFSVGIATPGALIPDTGLIKNANSVCLNGQPLLRDLENLLQRPLRMANDANCFALSEAKEGAAAGANTVFGVILGTGVGAGIVVHSQVLAGANGIAGEWGHNPLPWPQVDELPGPPCYCGKRGCIETWLSGPGLALAFRQATGLDQQAPEIVAAAALGDTASLRVLRAYEDRMARALSHVINILDPDVIVLGGGLSNIARWYDSIPRLWGKYVFSDRVTTRLLAPRFGDSSGVRGAAWLWD